MAVTSAEHDLLFGVTALQLRLVTQEQLVSATAANADGASLSLRERLCKLNLLSAAEAEAVEAAVRERLARFSNNARQALDSVGAAEAAVVSNALGAPTIAHRDSGAQTDHFTTQAPKAWSFSPQQQRFTILRLYQQGGLGRLMIAKDEELNREIALKEILPAFADSEENRRRFIREAEITGALEHPGIVPVYSLGEFPDGRPYYAMRLIRGVDLRTAIEDFHRRPASRAEKRLEFLQLLARFVTVCQAVDYAHNRGVIHRDLKPGNIMLGDFGETLVVDWGLAKTLDGRPSPEDFQVPAVTPSDRAQSDRTQAGRIVGTTRYMSPEQAAGRVDDLTAACDIYGLGATFYHLLAGRPPFEGDEDDIVFRVQQGRFAPPREYKRDVPKPLEAICLKAMARKPENRYGTARQMALDIQRYLADERVMAYREPWVSQAWRWTRHHRALVTSVAAVTAVTLAGLSVGAGVLKVQRDRAERNFERAQEAVRNYYVRVSEETLLNQPGMQPLRDALLRQALDYYQQFLEERSEDASLRREVALAEFYVGRISETVDTPAKALPHFEQAARLQRALVGRAPTHELNALKAELAQTLNAWGRALQNLQKLEEAHQRYEQAAEIREELATANPNDAEFARALASSKMNLGLLDLMSGKPTDALPLLEQAQGLRLAHVGANDATAPKLQRDLGMGYYNLAQAQLATGEIKEAKSSLLGAVGVFGKLVEQTPSDFDNRRRLAICHRMLGDAEAADEKVEDAIASYRRASEALTEMTRQNPDVPEYAADLAGVRMNMAQQLEVTGESGEALAELSSAAEELRKLADKGIAVPRYRSDLGVALRAAGELLASLGRREEARTRLQESRTVLQELVREHPTQPAFAAELKRTADALVALDAI
jgi:serine/threonine-protein kinase